MLNKHPGAQLLKTMGDPPVDVRFGNDEYIQCTSVTPEPNRSLPVFNNPDVPQAVRAYHEHRFGAVQFLACIRIDLCMINLHSAINLFSCSRPIVKHARDGSEETWIEKTYFTTEEVFPTVLRRSEIVAIETLDISPIENALNEIEEKTKELLALELKYSALAKTSQSVSTNALAMCLNSAVDSPVDAGMASYRQSFFSPEYVVRHPDRVDQVEKLKKAVEDQVRLFHCIATSLDRASAGSRY
jgi:dedicator of cytokinesis protein 3